MHGIAERIGSALDRAAPARGVEPVPDPERRLSGLDLFVLWGDLSVGLLVIVTGPLLDSRLGASVPCFLVAFVLSLALLRRGERVQPAASSS